jgi:hypothetical protein
MAFRLSILRRADSAAATFAKLYEAQPSEWRSWADSVLDAVGAAPSFPTGVVSQRIQVLRDWVYAGNARPGDGPTASSRADADAGSQERVAEIRRNAEIGAGSVDPNTGVVSVPLDHHYRNNGGETSKAAQRLCTQATAVAAWAVLPFLPPDHPPADVFVAV